MARLDNCFFKLPPLYGKLHQRKHGLYRAYHQNHCEEHDHDLFYAGSFLLFELILRGVFNET